MGLFIYTFRRFMHLCSSAGLPSIQAMPARLIVVLHCTLFSDLPSVAGPIYFRSASWLRILPRLFLGPCFFVHIRTSTTDLPTETFLGSVIYIEPGADLVLGCAHHRQRNHPTRRLAIYLTRHVFQILKIPRPPPDSLSPLNLSSIEYRQTLSPISIPPTLASLARWFRGRWYIRIQPTNRNVP